MVAFWQVMVDLLWHYSPEPGKEILLKITYFIFRQNKKKNFVSHPTELSPILEFLGLECQMKNLRNSHCHTTLKME